jgi:hypothetical protein
MPPVPTNELLRLTIAELDGQIFVERGRLTALVAANPPLPPEQLFGQSTHLYNLLTRRHMLEVQRTYPTVETLYQVEFLGVRDADGEFRRRPGPGRIADGGLLGDYLRLIEVKTVEEILRAFPKGRQQVYRDFLASSNLGPQIANDKRLLKWAGRRGVEFWFRARNTLTLMPRDFGVAVNDIGISLPQSYMNMGDGIEASTLYRQRPPSPTTSARGPGADPKFTPSTSPPRRVGPTAPEQPSAVENRALENRVSGGGDSRVNQPQGTFRGVEPPKSSLKGNLPSRTAYAVDPGGRLAGARSAANSLGAGAMAIYSSQVANFYGRAWREAEDAVGSRMKEIERWRGDGHWVLVRVLFAMPKVGDSQGGRPARFWSVEITHALPPSADSDAEVMLERLRIKKPDFYYTQRRHGSDVERHLHSDWTVEGQDYLLLPPFRPPMSASEEGRRHSIRGTAGTCVERRGITVPW